MVLESEISDFHQRLFSWWVDDNRRELPWRLTEEPYHIMVSEFMLQQTQVSRVIPKYDTFLKTFPTISKLAEANKSEVIKLWQGLGYNRRAIWLQEAAVKIDAMPQFPKDREALQQIRGIGPYTSRSIPIFAFNKDYAAVDTNIRRIYIHEGFITSEMSKTEVQKIADQLLPKGRARDYHNAMMDFGSTVVTSRKTGIKPRTSSTVFEGSNRQVRGEIIRLLTQHDEMSLDDLQSKIRSKMVEQNVDNLVRDGLVAQSDDIYHLAH